MKKLSRNPARRILTRTLATLIPTEALAVTGGARKPTPECYTTCGGELLDQCDPM